MANDNTSTSGGIGFTSLLTIAFIVLKLCNVIAWPWVWVLSPIWIGLALLLLIFGIVVVVATVISERKKQKRLKDWNAKIKAMEQKRKSA